MNQDHACWWNNEQDDTTSGEPFPALYYEDSLRTSYHPKKVACPMTFSAGSIKINRVMIHTASEALNKRCRSFALKWSSHCGRLVFGRIASSMKNVWWSGLGEDEAVVFSCGAESCASVVEDILVPTWSCYPVLLTKMRCKSKE